MNEEVSFMEPDVAGFKKGLASIMLKHQLAGITGYRGQFIGYWGKRETQFGMYCKFVPATLPKPFEDIFEEPTYDIQEILKDLKGLFNYYGVRVLTKQYLETFFIGPDDNNQFLMEYVDLDFFRQEKKVMKDE
jgi:hypothetical protein